MNREELIRFIKEQYGVDEEYPWQKSPGDAVCRHHSNRKWFALILDVPRRCIGLAGDTRISILNVKCDPLLIGSLRREPGIYPAYHMNKENWITLALDGSVPEDKIKWLLDISYTLTQVKTKAPRA